MQRLSLKDTALVESHRTEARLNALTDTANRLTASALPVARSASTASIGTQNVRVFQERESNNTIATANNIGGILFTGDRQTRTVSIQGNASQFNQDFFRFLPGNQATSTIELKTSTPGISFSVYKDANFNRQVDAGELVASGSSINLEAVRDQELYVAVRSSSFTARNYSVDLIAKPEVGNESEPNNLSSQAKNVGNILARRSYQGVIGGRTSITQDPNDWFKFNVTSTRQVSISFSDRNFDNTSRADLFLRRDTTGDGFPNQIIASSRSVPGRPSSHNIQQTLAAGTYFIQASALQGQVNYNLSFSAS